MPDEIGTSHYYPASQCIQLLHRLRQREVQHSTAIANQIRSLSREYGVIFSVGIKH